MSKNLIVKLAILLVVAALVYSVVWFFKIGQVEKQVNNYVSENSSYVSVGEVSVSGFPMSQKITIKDLKFTIPNQALDKRQVIVKQLEAKAGVFSSDFAVSVSDVALQDIDGNVAKVEFSKDPEITISIADGRISKFSYQDTGYRALDLEKNVVYAATSSAINFESAVGEGEKITAKITANIKDIEGFDVLDVYKNVFEKKVIEGIKTGEIGLGSVSTTVSTPTQTSSVVEIPNAVNSDAAAVASSLNPASPSATSDAAQPVASVNASVNADGIAAAVDNSNLVKSNLKASIEYVLTPNSTTQHAPIPLDPAQIQEAPVQYSQVLKITNFEFSNPIYKIYVNGEMSTFQDDNMPSGSIGIKVENASGLISYIAAGFSKMADQKKPTTSAEVQSSDLANNGMLAEDSYQNFLRKVSANLDPVAKELAAKNAVSKDDIAAFDVRREKNLEFLVNEVSIREILGKF
jgi:predicted transcriptional regulator